MSKNVEPLSALGNEVYPVFEPNQLLTSNHLNQLRNYLDTQDRYSRVHLVGVGVVCGLEVKYKDDELTISSGTGITSDGFLIKLPRSIYKQCSTVEYTEPQPYPLFALDPADPESERIKLWELLPADSEVTPTVSFEDAGTARFLEDKVVLLFVEFTDIDLESCLGENCDDKGITRNFTIRKLLVKCTEVNKIIQNGYGVRTMPRFDNLQNHRFLPTFLPTPAFRLIPDGVDTWGDLQRKYREMTSSEYILNRYQALYPSDARLNILFQLAENIKKTYGIYKPVLGELISESKVNELRDRFAEQYDKYRNDEAIQYFYDYTKDLIKAYNEFVHEAFEITANCTPKYDTFPRHLLLGKVFQGSACPEDSCKPSLYRTHFVSSPIYGNQVEQLKKVKSLFMRLMTMVQEFVTDEEEYRSQPKVIPSCEKKGLLENRAIPFYYGEGELHQYWNYELSKRCSAGWNRGYHSKRFDPPVRALNNPLLLSTDDYDFYRIEPVIGHEYQEVWKNLEILKRKHHLDFDVVPLKMRISEEKAAGLNDHCGLVELKENYLQLRNEIIVQLQAMNTFMKRAFFIEFNISLLIDESKPTSHPAARATDKDTGEKSRFDKMVELFFKTKYLPEIRDVIETIPKCLEEFNVQRYLEADAKLKKLLFTLVVMTEKTIRNMGVFGLSFHYIYQRISIDLSGVSNYYDIYQYLNSTLDIRMGSLYTSYQKRLDLIEREHLFSVFAKRNPGLEHMAGVPKGGTFILVYGEDGEKEKVIADFALNGKPCCCKPEFPDCNDFNYAPIARNVYRFVALSEYDSSPILLIDIFDGIIDLNVNSTILYGLLGKDKTALGGKIRIEYNDIMDREVILYEPPKGVDNVFDTFEYQIIHEDKVEHAKTGVGTVYVALIPSSLGMKPIQEAYSCCEQDEKPKEEKAEEVSEGASGGSGATYTGSGSGKGGSSVWTRGNNSLRVAEFHESLISAEDNIAKDIIEDMKDMYKHLEELGPLKENPSAEDLKEREKEIVGAYKNVIDETVRNINVLDRQIGDEPDDLTEKMIYRMEMADKYAARDAMVKLYENQVESLGKAISEEGLAAEEGSELYDFVDNDLRNNNEKVTGHTNAPKVTFQEHVNKGGLPDKTDLLFKSF